MMDQGSLKITNIQLPLSSFAFTDKPNNLEVIYDEVKTGEQARDTNPDFPGSSFPG